MMAEEEGRLWPKAWAPEFRAGLQFLGYFLGNPKRPFFGQGKPAPWKFLGLDSWNSGKPLDWNHFFGEFFPKELHSAIKIPGELVGSLLKVQKGLLVNSLGWKLPNLEPNFQGEGLFGAKTLKGPAFGNSGWKFPFRGRGAATGPGPVKLGFYSTLPFFHVNLTRGGHFSCG